MTQGSGTEDEDQLREIKEAQDACEAALTSLGQAQRAVDSAQSWGTYDTWFGGGLFSSLMKHDRIDDAEEFMRAVRGEGAALSNIVDYAGPLTETVLLGNLAVTPQTLAVIMLIEIITEYFGHGAFSFTIIAQHFFETILGPVWVYLLIGEEPRLATVMGGAVILSGVMLSAWSSGRAPVRQNMADHRDEHDGAADDRRKAGVL